MKIDLLEWIHYDYNGEPSSTVYQKSSHTLRDRSLKEYCRTQLMNEHETASSSLYELFDIAADKYAAKLEKIIDSIIEGVKTNSFLRHGFYDAKIRLMRGENVQWIWDTETTEDEGVIINNWFR